MYKKDQTVKIVLEEALEIQSYVDTNEATIDDQEDIMELFADDEETEVEAMIKETATTNEMLQKIETAV